MAQTITKAQRWLDLVVFVVAKRFAEWVEQIDGCSQKERQLSLAQAGHRWLCEAGEWKAVACGSAWFGGERPLGG